MVVCYVKLGTDDSKAHALLLPDALPPFEWHELDVRPSALQGNGVFPSNSMVKRKRWASTHEIPILLPYFGHETIVHGEHELDVVLKVLQGDFETVLLDELQREHGVHEYVADGLFAVRKDAPGQCSKLVLPPSTQLLQLEWSSSSTDDCCYVIADDVRVDLGLVGERAHLFERLCSRGTSLVLVVLIVPGGGKSGTAAE